MANILGLVIGSALTQVSDEEKAVRMQLFKTPAEELDPVECRKTKFTVLSFLVFGLLVAVALLVLWVIPYNASLG